MSRRGNKEEAELEEEEVVVPPEHPVVPTVSTSDFFYDEHGHAIQNADGFAHSQEEANLMLHEAAIQKLKDEEQEDIDSQ